MIIVIAASLNSVQFALAISQIASLSAKDIVACSMNEIDYWN